MKRFIGTKTILAQAMTRTAYNTYRGWGLPGNENGNDEGYLVEYTDGGTPNDARHSGYISWSPKEQFDNAYRERPLAPGLAPHQQRVVDEGAELIERLEKLHAFFEMPLFAGLPADEQRRMADQALAMSTYAEILTERIAAFPLHDDAQAVAEREERGQRMAEHNARLGIAS
jgi:hypothetical protein